MIGRFDEVYDQVKAVISKDVISENEWATIMRTINENNGLINYQPERKDQAGNVYPDQPILHLALRTWNMEMVKWLLEQGASVYAKDKNGNNAIHTATHSPKLLKLLLEYVPENDRQSLLNSKNNHLLTPLMLGINNIDVVDYLIEQKVDLNVRSKSNEGCFTALHYALWFTESSEIALKLIDAGANINIRDDKGYHAIHWAVDRGLVDVFKKLIEINPKLINVKDNAGNTPLTIALNSKKGQKLLPDIYEASYSAQEQSLLWRKRLYNVLNICTFGLFSIAVGYFDFWQDKIKKVEAVPQMDTDIKAIKKRLRDVNFVKEEHEGVKPKKIRLPTEQSQPEKVAFYMDRYQDKRHQFFKTAVETGRTEPLTPEEEKMLSDLRKQSIAWGRKQAR